MNRPTEQYDYDSLKTALHSQDVLNYDRLVDVLDGDKMTSDIAELFADVFCNKESEYYRDSKRMVCYIAGYIRRSGRNSSLFPSSNWFVKCIIDEGVRLCDLPDKWFDNEYVINYSCDVSEYNVILMYREYDMFSMMGEEWMDEWRSKMIGKWLAKYPTLVCELNPKWYTYEDYITAVKGNYDAFDCSNREYLTIDAALYAMMGGSDEVLVGVANSEQREILKSILCI